MNLNEELVRTRCQEIEESLERLERNLITGFNKKCGHHQTRRPTLPALRGPIITLMRLF